METSGYETCTSQISPYLEKMVDRRIQFYP